jgi:hypothetical protein
MPSTGTLPLVWKTVDSTIDASGVLALRPAMLLPASLISDRQIVIGVGQHMRISFLPEFYCDAIAK